MNSLHYTGRVNNRIDLAHFMNIKGLLGTMVEVGVWRGDFAKPFLDLWKGQKMILVDPWSKLDDYDDIRNRDFKPTDYEFVQRRFKRYGDRVFIHRALSMEAVQTIRADGSLDGVYIDANHAYDHILKDMWSWWRKVKPGGILAGHDIFSFDHPQVTTAVVQFCLEEEVVCDLIPGDYDKDNILVNAASWFIEKPK